MNERIRSIEIFGTNEIEMEIRNATMAYGLWLMAMDMTF